MGVVLWQIFLGLPVMLAVGCLIAAVPFPVTLVVVVALITGTPVVSAIPVLTRH